MTEALFIANRKTSFRDQALRDRVEEKNWLKQTPKVKNSRSDAVSAN